MFERWDGSKGIKFFVLYETVQTIFLCAVKYDAQLKVALINHFVASKTPGQIKADGGVSFHHFGGQQKVEI